MLFRRLEGGIYIDYGCNGIIKLSGGWYVPDHGDETVSQTMAALEEKFKSKPFKTNTVLDSKKDDKNMPKATHILYDDGTTVELKPEDIHLAHRIRQMQGAWSACTANHKDKLILEMAPEWRQYTDSLYLLWSDLSFPLLPKITLDEKGEMVFNRPYKRY